MATLTSLQAAASYPLRLQEKGNFTIAGEYTLTATLASGDVIQMFKIPAGVTVLDLKLVHPNVTTAGAGAVGTAIWNVGDGADTNRFAESHTAAVNGTFMLSTTDLNTATLQALPYKYDLSDNDPNGYDTVDIQVIAAGTTGTSGGTIKLVATCTYDYP